DVVHVPFAHAGLRHANQLRGALKRGHGLTAAIAHAGAQAAHQLVNHPGHAALVRDAALDPLRNELLGRVRIALLALEVGLVLEISIAAAFAHRAERAHAAV